MFSNFLYKSFLIMILFIIFCFMGLFYILNFTGSLAISADNTFGSDIVISSSEFIWPTPNYSTITSYFGYRKAPTAGAGTFHGGIDIAAPAGANIVASFSGTVTYIGFLRCKWIYCSYL